MDQPKILVAIRKRPLSKKEESKGDTDIITCKNEQTVIVSEYKQKVDLTKYIEETVFNFDYAFNEQSTNEQIYDNAIRPLVDSAFQGAKVTCFAYGQTGSGKTFTMNGNAKMGVVGLYQLGAEDIFAYLADPRFQHLKAKLSFFQIYCGKLYDLLNKRQQLKIRQDNKQNINIIGLEEREISDSRQFHQYMQYGSTQRITSENSANSQSSRSHAILQVILKEGKKTFGKISFIDLAGNQRGADHTDMKKQTRIDGAQINKSLLSLKECIRALDQGKGHTPFRGSKLTMVLKDSFVGFCRTFMIGNVSPSSASSQNTLNTLRYADRVKQLRKPSENLTKQELRARQMMLPRQNKNAFKIDINNDDDAEDIEIKRQEAQKNYGIKEQPRESSADPNKKFQQQRNRQQSFSGSSSRPNLVNNLKSSQQVVPSKSVKQPTPAQNVAKVNMANDKKAPITNVPARPSNMPMNNNSMVGNPNTVNNASGLHRNNSMTVNNHNRFGERMDEQPTNRRDNGNGNGNGNNPRWFNNNYTNSNPNSMPNINPNNNNNNYRQQNMNYGQKGQEYGMNQNQSGMNNDKMNQYRNNYQQPQNYSSVNSGLNYQSNYNNNNYSNQNYNNYPNQGYQQQQNNFRQHQPQPQPQKLIIPEDWNGMLEFLNNTNDPQLRYRVQKKLHQVLFHEENQLISSHSDSLRSSLDVTKAQMSLISSLQANRDAVGTRQYLNLLQQSIDEKISLLEFLKEKMVQFSYKLDAMEQIQGIEGGDEGRMFEEDQLLLDDLH